MKVQADAVNGIFEVSEFDGEPMPYDVFIKCLKDCTGEALECNLTDKQAKYLDESYGIRRSHSRSRMTVFSSKKDKESL
jgi:hypothetical protein